jgi:hypothetical protein
MSVEIRESPEGVSFSVHVRPRASREEIQGTHGKALAVKLTAPPVEGAANEALRKLLARALGVSPSAVEITAGQTGRAKVVRVKGARAEQVRALAGEKEEA